MDEQMISKRTQQHTQALQTGEWMGKRLNRLAGLWHYAKTLATPIRARHA